MTLVERSEDIKRRLAYQGRLKASQELARQIQDRTGTIRRWHKAAATAHGQLRALLEAGRSVPVAASTDAVLACHRFSEKTEERTDGDGDWAAFKATVEKQVSTLEAHAMEGAKAAQAQLRERSISHLEAIAKIQGKEAQFAAARQEKALLEKETWVARPADELRALLRRLARLLELVDSLSDLKAPLAVQTFLDKARRSEALVTDLTPEVRTWFDQNDLTGRLRITLGGA